MILGVGLGIAIIVGSNVLADQRLDINAGGKLNIEAAQNTQSGSSFNETQKSGLFGSGGIGFTIGKQQQSTDTQNTQTTAAASTVGAIAGDVRLSAGQTYTQRGSDVVAPGGDVNISAQRVTIEEARETASSQTEQKAKQSGLTVAVNVPIVQSAQALAKTVQATGDTNSTRMQALGAATAALQAKELADQAGKIGDALAKGGDIREAANISVSLGSSRSQSNQHSSSDSARGSSVTAGGDVNISARGAGTDSDITIQGSTVKADGTTRLSAEDEVRLLAAKNTQTETNSQSSKSGSIGVGIQLGAGGAHVNELEGQFLAGFAVVHAKLCWYRGIEVQIQNPLVPMALMPIQPLDAYDVEYDFLRPGWTPPPPPGLFAKVKRLFS